MLVLDGRPATSCSDVVSPEDSKPQVQALRPAGTPYFVPGCPGDGDSPGEPEARVADAGLSGPRLADHDADSLPPVVADDLPPSPTDGILPRCAERLPGDAIDAPPCPDLPPPDAADEPL